MTQLTRTWGRIVEASFVVGAFCTAVVLGFLIMWMQEDRPPFLESPVMGSHYISNPQVHAGDMVYTVRSLRRLDACPVRTGYSLVSVDTGVVFPGTGSISLAAPTREFREVRAAYPVPRALPPGRYLLRLVVACQRNPLVEVGQALFDLAFEVAP